VPASASKAMCRAFSGCLDFGNATQSVPLDALGSNWVASDTFCAVVKGYAGMVESVMVLQRLCDTRLSQRSLDSNSSVMLISDQSAARRAHCHDAKLA